MADPSADPASDLFEPPAVLPAADSPSSEHTRPRTAVLPVERATAALEVLICSGFPTQMIVGLALVTFGMKPKVAGEWSPPFIFTLELIDTALVVCLVAFFLGAHRESAQAALFGSRRPTRDVAIGLALVPASFGVVIGVLLIVQLTMPSLHNVWHNPLQALAQTRGDALMLALVVMIAGGVREEVQRGFVLRRFEQYLGGGAVGLLIFSAAFGLGHIDQGHDVIVATAVLGAFWGAIYLRRRSILGPMIGHAGFNLIEVIWFVVVGG